jgi:hypothetical protein
MVNYKGQLIRFLIEIVVLFERLQGKRLSRDQYVTWPRVAQVVLLSVKMLTATTP